MLTVFISYAREDQPTVKRLEQVLQAHGVNIWRDEQNLRGGEWWPLAIAEAIEACDPLLTPKKCRCPLQRDVPH